MMRPWESVMMVRPYIEPGMPLLYPRWWDDGEEKLDHNYMLFNRPGQHSEKIGVVVETLKGTAIVACKYFVRYNSFARVVARTQRCWSHDEDNACVVGDVVMIKTAPRRGKFKAHLGIAFSHLLNKNVKQKNIKQKKTKNSSKYLRTRSRSQRTIKKRIS